MRSRSAGCTRTARSPAYVSVDDLLGKHFAILGTTGSGKSWATALLLHAIIERHPNAHIVVLDPHAEYAHAFKDRAECIEPDDLRLPHWLFTFEEMVEIVFGAEAPALVAGASAPTSAPLRIAILGW